jgi:ATP-dependent DNA ligase
MVELARKLKERKVSRCPFVDLPSEGSSRWGGGVSEEDMKVRGTSHSRGRRSSHWSGGIAAEEMSGLVWVKPILVVQVSFREWTAEGRLRHAAFIALRNDKIAEDVRRE